jgi:tetratricopeptide (TPR) repeat protein
MPSSMFSELSDLEDRAICVAREHLPETARQLVVCLERHGITLWSNRNPLAARAALEEACKTSEEYSGASPPTAYAMATLVDVLFELGEPEDALPLCKRVFEMEKANESGDAAVALASSQLGRCLLLLGEYEAADEHLTIALRLRERAYPIAGQDRLADAWRVLLDQARFGAGASLRD